MGKLSRLVVDERGTATRSCGVGATVCGAGREPGRRSSEGVLTGDVDGRVDCVVVDRVGNVSLFTADDRGIAMRSCGEDAGAALLGRRSSPRGASTILER